MYNPLKHLAKSLYDGTWDDEVYMILFLFMPVFAVIILIMSIICVTGNMEPNALGDLAKVLPPNHVAWKFIAISLGISVISIILAILASEKYPVDSENRFIFVIYMYSFVVFSGSILIILSYFILDAIIRILFVKLFDGLNNTLEYIFKQFKPKKPSNITEKSMINSYNQLLKR